MKKLKVLSFIMALLIYSMGVVYGESSTYTPTSVNGVKVNYITIDMNDKSISTKVLNAGNQMTTVDSLNNMASGAGAFAAINGTYFEDYNGTPVPWRTIIRDEK